MSIRKIYTTAEYHQMVASLMKEREWMQQVIETLQRLQYLAYHVYDSRQCTCSGYPDITALRLPPRPRFLLIETKTETGKASHEQEIWLTGARAAGIEAYIFQPHDRDEMIEILKRDA